jgi:hypothetical protein
VIWQLVCLFPAVIPYSAARLILKPLRSSAPEGKAKNLLLVITGNVMGWEAWEPLNNLLKISYLFFGYKKKR